MAMKMKMDLLSMTLLLMLTTVVPAHGSDTQPDLSVAALAAMYYDHGIPMFVAILCGIGMLGVLVAFGHELTFPQFFSLRKNTNGDQDQLSMPNLKLFDRIQEFHSFD